MIRLQNLTLQRGPQRLLEGAELTLHAGHKAGLIGANGAGKSSLFALLRGELTPDAGDCLLPGDWRIAHMRQEVDTLDRLAVDYVLDGDHNLRRVQAELAAAEQAHDGAAIARLQGRLWQPLRLSAQAEQKMQSRPGRTEFLRGVFHQDASGVLRVRTTGPQGSGILSSMADANCLIEIVPAQPAIAVGERVWIHPLQGRVA